MPGFLSSPASQRYLVIRRAPAKLCLLTTQDQSNLHMVNASMENGGPKFLEKHDDGDLDGYSLSLPGLN